MRAARRRCKASAHRQGYHAAPETLNRTNHFHKLGEAVRFADVTTGVQTVHALHIIGLGGIA